MLDTSQKAELIQAILGHDLSPEFFAEQLFWEDLMADVEDAIESAGLLRCDGYERWYTGLEPDEFGNRFCQECCEAEA